MRKMLPSLNSVELWLQNNGFSLQPDGRWAKNDCRASIKRYGPTRFEVRTYPTKKEAAHPPFKSVETDLLEWCNERGCYCKVGELYSADVCSRIANKMNEA